MAPWTDARLAVEYRYVALAEAGSWLDGYLDTVAIGGAGEELAQELDAWATWRPWPVLDLVGGYSALVVSQNARDALNTSAAAAAVDAPRPPPYTASIASFAYLQATLRVP